LNVLVVDDDPVIRHKLSAFLKKWNHQVTAAPDGDTALEMFLSHSVDLVITDWMMPGMDGPELVRRIRRSGLPYVYILILTARGEKGDLVSGLFDIGADDYVVKPFDPDELRARVFVGERTVRLERSLREYSAGLEKIVRRQTQVIRETHEETIVKLLTALESRDHETAGHVRRISAFSAMMAEAAGWPQSRVDDLRLASPMHDIGKIGVPDQILLKPGRLTDAEFEIIKTHSTIGGRIFQGSEFPMLKMAHDIALHHHERWDGQGYPDGFGNDDIPEPARIVALVDVYDAMSNDRVYRKAFPEKKVLEIMETGRGTHFDPDYFDLFMKLVPEFRTMLEETG
jgi:putative two-component system response regulator